MGLEIPFFIKAYSHQLRRDASASAIPHDFNLEIGAFPDDYVTDAGRLRFSGLAFRLTRAQHPRITSAFIGLIHLKKPRFFKLDREDYLERVRRLDDANDDETLDVQPFKTLIALSGIFGRDLELKIFLRKNGKIEICLRGNGPLGKVTLTELQSYWLTLGSSRAAVKRPSARRGNPQTRR